jgi:hypothetical protein
VVFVVDIVGATHAAACCRMPTAGNHVRTELWHSDARGLGGIDRGFGVLIQQIAPTYILVGDVNHLADVLPPVRIERVQRLHAERLVVTPSGTGTPETLSPTFSAVGTSISASRIPPSARLNSFRAIFAAFPGPNEAISSRGAVGGCTPSRTHCVR